LRVVTATAIACIVGYAYVTPLPRVLFPIIRVLYTPVDWLWLWFYPNWDTFPPFIPSDNWSNLLVFLGIAVPAYTAVLYVPAVASWVLRVTRMSMRSRVPFIVYFLAGAVLAAMLGIVRWSESAGSRSPRSLYMFIGGHALAGGWLLGVCRWYLGLRYREKCGTAV